MGASSGAYAAIRQRITTSTAITVLQLTPSSTTMIELVRSTANQSSSTTSGTCAVALLRKTAAATGASSVTPAAMSDGMQASGVTAERDATGEGTDGAITYEEGFNIVGNGFLYLPVPEEREVIGPSEVFAQKFFVAPSSSTWSNQIRWLEYRF